MRRLIFGGMMAALLAVILVLATLWYFKLEAKPYPFVCSNGVTFSITYDSPFTISLSLNNGRQVELILQDPFGSTYSSFDGQVQFTAWDSFVSLKDGPVISADCLPALTIFFR